MHMFLQLLIHYFRLLDYKKEINIYIECLQKMKLVFQIHLKFLVLLLLMMHLVSGYSVFRFGNSM